MQILNYSLYKTKLDLFQKSQYDTLYLKKKDIYYKVFLL